MAAPSNPTVTGVVTEGLKRGGRVNPSSLDITNSTNNQFQEVKSDIRRRARHHPLLVSLYAGVTVVGQNRYTIPSDHDGVIAVSLWDGPDDYRGTAQTGASSTITLASDFDQAAADVEGRFLVTTGGTGPNQTRQILDYDNSTKVATMESAWTTTPTSSTTYLVVNSNHFLYEQSKSYVWNRKTAPMTLGRPQKAMIQGDTLWTDYNPDKIYGLIYDYWLDLTSMDEAATQFIKILRQWRSIFIQGVAVKTNQRWDDRRYNQEFGVYTMMLDELASECGPWVTVEPSDV